MKYKTNKICDLRHFTPESYVLKNTIWKSANNKQIWAPNDYNKQHFLCSNLMSWPGLCESDNIKRMITLTVITLSGAYCTKSTQNPGWKTWNILLRTSFAHVLGECDWLFPPW